MVGLGLQPLQIRVTRFQRVNSRHAGPLIPASRRIRDQSKRTSSPTADAITIACWTVMTAPPSAADGAIVPLAEIRLLTPTISIIL